MHPRMQKPPLRNIRPNKITKHAGKGLEGEEGLGVAFGHIMKIWLNIGSYVANHELGAHIKHPDEARNNGEDALYLKSIDFILVLGKFHIF